MKTMRPYLLTLLSLLLAACATDQPAPVIERAPPTKKMDAAKKLAQPAAKPAEIAADKDWRPEVYTVKRGDTLHAIGLEYGYDYKEIAQANFIDPPYVIRPGQQLRIRQSTKAPVSSPTSDDVVVSPLKTEPPAVSTITSAPAPANPAVTDAIPLLKEPKALRESYSLQALATAPASPAKPAVSATAKVADTAKIDPTKPAQATEPAKPDSSDGGSGDDDEIIDWAWPAKGKVIAGFNDATNAKGIDIVGSQGQAVLAAAPGKVIYSGSDLRGYGKLVIIKHNKTYLSVYAHNSQILVKEGQQVVKGQKIGEMGNSDTDSVKLHFEIRRQGKSVDPAKYLSGNSG